METPLQTGGTDLKTPASRFSVNGKHVHLKRELVENDDVTLPPFSLIRDFGKQNNRGNVSKISVSLACYRQLRSRSSNHSH